MKTTVLRCALVLSCLLAGCSATSAWLATPEVKAQKAAGCAALKADHERHYALMHSLVKDPTVLSSIEAEHRALEKFFDACLASAQSAPSAQ
jgi:N-acetylglutamate synthase-like GNAT family acetyltransferase